MRIAQSPVNLILATAFVGCFFFGCSKAPDAELAAARAAIKAATDAEADKYMVNNYQNLVKVMESAEAEIAVQNKAFVLTRKYKNVTEKLGKITSLANEIAAEAPTIKAEAIAQVKSNLGLAKGMLEASAADIKMYTKKTDKNVIAELKADLVVADSAANRAATAFGAGDVLGAKKELAEVQRIISKITSTLKPKTEENM